MNNTMYICVSANSKYMRYLYVMLVSLFETNGDCNIEVFIFQRDFSQNDKFAMNDLASKYNQKISFIEIDESDFDCLPTTFRYSIETYFRFKIIDLIPQRIEKVLYLDVDLLIRGSLKDLYDTCLDNYYFAACTCMIEPKLIASKQDLFGRYDDLRYFNAGVMLWNLKALRGNVNFNTFIEAGRKLDFNLPCVDQEILNFLYYKNNLYLDPIKYNYLVLHDLDGTNLSTPQTIIYHYNWFNPWQVGPKSAKYDEWWRCAKKTPYYEDLIFEQLLRTEEYIKSLSEKNNMEDAIVFRENVYEMLLNLDNNVRMKNKMENGEYAIFGAGKVGTIFYNFLVRNGLDSCIKEIIDLGGKKTFLGREVLQSIENLDKGIIIIVTPSNEVEKIVKSLQEQCGDYNKVISLLDFLRTI